jgi:hypothetical protein
MNKIYAVGLTVTVRKVYNIAAPDEQTAIDMAKDCFSYLDDAETWEEMDFDFIEEIDADIPTDAEYGES